MVHLNKIHSIPALPQLSEREIPLQTGRIDSTGLPLPTAPRWSTIFPGGAGHQHFSSCLKYLYLRLSSRPTIAKRWEAPFCPGSVRLYLGVAPPRITGALITLTLLLGQGFHTGRGKLRSRVAAYPLSTECSPPGESLKRSLTLFPLALTWLRDFCLERSMPQNREL